MKRHKSKRVDQTGALRLNLVFEHWTEEELGDLCLRVADAICRRYECPQEKRNIAHYLWLRLREEGYKVKKPREMGAIYKVLRWWGQDKLRSMHNEDRKLEQLETGEMGGDPEEGGRATPIAKYAVAEEMLEKLSAEELLRDIFEKAGRQQEVLRSIVEARIEGKTQTEIALLFDIPQYKISRMLLGLRKQLRR